MSEIVEPKYYFIYYNCKSYGWRDKGLTTGGWVSNGYTDLNFQDVTDIHPLQWQIDCNEKYGKEREENPGYKKRENYEVISWQSLTLEEYKLFKDKIG